jgi:hypothetical protein
MEHPIVDFTGSTPLARLYPGAAYVDLFGLDGYNWATSAAGSVWPSPAQVFGPTISVVRRITSRPVILCEVASSEDGGNKAHWVSEFFCLSRADDGYSRLCLVRSRTGWSRGT